MLPTITIEGRVVADPELRFTGSGAAVANFRIAASDSKKDDAGNWQTTEQLFVNVAVWKDDAEQVAEHVRKGDLLIVTGRLYQREYEASNGEKRTSLEVKFPTVAKVVRAERRALAATAPAPSSVDPWATTGGTDNPPF